jgi:hypothetical protein
MLPKIFRIILIFLALFISCDLPEDPRNTFNEIINNKLKVGYAESKPWVVLSAKKPKGIEAWIVTRIAEEINSDILWIRDSEPELMKMLKDGKLHLVISGINTDSPWASEVGFTKPYYISADDREYVIAVPPGENKWLLYIESFLIENKNEIYSYIRNSSK